MRAMWQVPSCHSANNHGRVAWLAGRPPLWTADRRFALRSASAVVVFALMAIVTGPVSAQPTGESVPDPCVNRIDIAVHRAIERFDRSAPNCDWFCTDDDQKLWARVLLQASQDDPFLKDYLHFVAAARHFSLDGWTTGISFGELQKQQEIYNFMVPVLFWYPDSEVLPTAFAQGLCGGTGRARTGPQYGPHDHWSVILHGDLGSQAEATSRAGTIARTYGYGDGSVAVLFSTDYENLVPGYWVVAVIWPETQLEAVAEARLWHERGYGGAYPRWLGGARQY
jgi:hypothetical protein